MTNSTKELREPAGEILLNQSEVARQFGISKRTLEGWRLRGGGPPYLVLGGRRAVRYRPSALEEWLNSRTRISTSDSGEGNAA